jgi:hypothetical protein
MTTEAAEAKESAGTEQVPCYGYVIIEWPPPRPGGGPRAMPAWGCAIFDAATGKPVLTVTKITVPSVTAPAAGFVTCDLTMFADEAGLPVLLQREDGAFAEGGLKTGTFRFYVAEMRVRHA